MTSINLRNDLEIRQSRDTAAPDRIATRNRPVPRCSIIIPVFNNLSLTRHCVDVLLRVPPAVPHEIIVADDASTDSTPEALASYGDLVKVVNRGINGGFANACNDGAAAALGEYLVFLNNDTIPQTGWLDAMVSYADRHPRAAVVGAKLLHPDNTVQHAGVVIAFDKSPRHIYRGFPRYHPAVSKSRRFQVVTGGCALVRRAAFHRVGGFDSTFVNCYEDVDFCLRLGELGEEIHYCAEAELYHLESVSREDQTLFYNLWLYRRRWADRVTSDEFDFFYEDGFLRATWGYLYPIDISLSPEVATVSGLDGLREANRLIAERSRQVWDLLRRQTKLAAKTPSPVPLPQVSAAAAPAAPSRSLQRIRKGKVWRPMSGSSQELVSVVVPVSAATSDLGPLLERLRLQQRTRPVELVVLDGDGSPEAMELYRVAEATVLSVPEQVLMSAGSIVRAVSHARGQFLVVIEPGLFPADENWLTNLVNRAAADERIAAASSRVLPGENWDAAATLQALDDRRALGEEWLWGGFPPDDRWAVRRDDLLCFPFHLGATVFRREMLERIPLDGESPLAAAAIWAQRVAEAGSYVVNVPQSVVVAERPPSYVGSLRAGLEIGTSALEVGSEPVQASEVFSRILWHARNDWDRLESAEGMTPAELDNARMAVVLRRTMQVTGEWLGLHAKYGLPRLLDELTPLWRSGDPRERALDLPAPTTSPVAQPGLERVAVARAKIAPLPLFVSTAAPPRVNLLIPEVNFRHFFGGYIAKLHLAHKLAGRGRRVRIIVVDWCEWTPDEWVSQLAAYDGLGDVLDEVEVVPAFDRQRVLEVSPSDTFIATTWWTAHLAHDATKRLGRERFLYLIQEYEPFTFAMGSFASLASQSYTFPHFAVFSTDLLRDYFREQRLGVFTNGSGDSLSVAFENAITRVDPPSSRALKTHDRCRLLFYARPEDHASRNMFELGCLALIEAIEEGTIGWDWELAGIGGLGQQNQLDLGRGIQLQMLPRLTQDEYATVLPGFDIGMSLMYTPHPSLVPIEMASAGMLVVTNTFETKTADRLLSISGNLIPVEPSVAAIKDGLRTAISRLSETDARTSGANVRWARSWDDAFSELIMEGIDEFLRSI